MSPAIKSAADREALLRGLLTDRLDTIGTDHAPHLQSEKELEFLNAPFGIAGLECALALYVKALVEPGIIDWPALIAMMTYKPAAIIGVDKGTLAKGAQADVTIIDHDADCTIDTSKFQSKSRNCPYDGWLVKTRVEKTIVDGEIRYSI